ncbi:MAG: hypothetical protein O6928_03360 [Gammaproteobacteria bacterium]|nr:hypothetical protein [Gammaproteobacteria bacterium]
MASRTMKMVNSNNLDEMLNTLRSTEPYLADDGFTSGVIAMLPEARQLPFWLTNLIMLGFTAIGSAIAAWQLPVMKLVSFTATSTLSLPTTSTLSLAVLGTAAISTFLISYIVIWLAQNDSI